MIIHVTGPSSMHGCIWTCCTVYTINTVWVEIVKGFNFITNDHVKFNHQTHLRLTIQILFPCIGIIQVLAKSDLLYNFWYRFRIKFGYQIGAIWVFKSIFCKSSQVTDHIIEFMISQGMLISLSKERCTSGIEFKDSKAYRIKIFIEI